MSRNLFVLLLLAVICTTVMSHYPTKPPHTEPPTKPPHTKPPHTKPPHTKPPTKPPHTKPPHTKPPTKPPTKPHKDCDVTKPPPKCGKNEIWSECGALCQPSCKNPKPLCPKICVKGCICKHGLLRNLKYKCVQPCDC